jgi:hypothetical protein
MKRIEWATNNVRSEMQAMFDGRKADIEELTKPSLVGPSEGQS